MGKISVLLCLCVTVFVLSSADISADDVYDILSSKLDNVYFDIKNLRSDIKEITEKVGPTGQSHDVDNVTDLKRMFDIFKNEINDKFSSLEETLKKDAEKYCNELSIPGSFKENRYALITGKTMSAEKKLIRRKLAEMEQKLEYRTKEAEESIEDKVLQILKFEKDKCKVPYDGMDDRLTLTDGKNVSLSGGSDVESGTFVYFDCSKADQPIYEPSNRIFKCVKGDWREADKDLDWNFGNEGAFPKCRKAICEPNCTHGGICIKDNSCQCQELTEGERCEIYICDAKCFNGGLCIGPGECECHEGRYGPNCEHEYCVFPKNAANLTYSKTKYSAGETLTTFTCDQGFVLSSNGGMTCMQNGIWSELVTCRKAMCVPNCRHGGICVKDNSCRCPYLTAGKRCERYICDTKCLDNGGRCIGPGECECQEGRYGQNCEHEYCVLPKNAAKLRNSKTKYSAGETLTAFTCDQGFVLSSNGGMTCMHNGMWSEIVTCQKAICEPNCAHGGICVKDNSCQCPDYTEGERCERHICDAKCLENGGRCIGPGECECHEGRYGPNCEHEYCVLPNNAANHKYSKTKYSAGETLTSFTCDDGFFTSSNGGMTCMQNGLWSEIVTCQKAVHYTISVKTGSGWNYGTRANVYVTLQGMNVTTERIEFQSSFERGGFKEIRIQARDIRPIKSIVIGHDGSGFFSDWFVEYASIYVEDMEEYYVFPYNGWVYGNNDVVIQSEGDCLSSFDEGHFWRPKWNIIGHFRYIEIEEPSLLSLRVCKQACVTKGERCVAIQYNRTTGRCIVYAVNQTRYFTDLSKSRNTWDSPVYLRTCK